MASGTARARKPPARHARHRSEPLSLATWIKQISPAGWIALGAGIVALALALQTLQGPIADYDEGVYWQSLRAMANGHPLFSSVFSSQPPLFLLSVYPFYMLFGQGLSAARMALVVFSVAGIAGTSVAGRALGHRNIGAVACAVLALDPLYQHGAHTLQAEMPSVALQIWAVAFAVLAMRASGRRQGWLAMGAGVLLGCALLIKLFAVVALVPVVLYLSVPLIRRWHGDNDTLRRPSWPEIQAGLRQIAPTIGWLVAGLAGAVFLILLPFANQLGALYDQVVRFHLAAAETDPSSLAHNFGIILTTLAGTPLTYVSIFALLFIVWRRMWMSAPLLLWALAAFIVLLRQQPLLGHHIVLLSPTLALIGGCGVFAAWQALPVAKDVNSRRMRQAAIAALLVLAVGSGLVLNVGQNAQANGPVPARSLEMAIALQSVSAPTEVVVSDDQYIAALANRDVPPQLVDTSAVRITSGYLTASQLEDYITRNRVHVILFATGRFDLMPGFRDWVAARYTRVGEFSHGGALYLLEPANNAPV